MPSPETEPNGEDPALLLASPVDTARGHKGRDAPTPSHGPRWLGMMLGLLIAAPVALTLAGAVTSPPHVKGVPAGRLIYLEADEPSDHTALLRGLRVMGPDGASRQLLHETEPQDRDAGSREWISQPAASPDGHWLAFEKQVITLQEEQQSIDNQLWVMPLTGTGPPPRMLLDLSKQKLKQFIGLAWTLDSTRVVFLNDAVAFFCPISGRGQVIKHALKSAIHSQTKSDESATVDPTLSAKNELVYMTTTPQAPGTPDAVSPDGTHQASVPSFVTHRIEFFGPAVPPSVEARWGWSVFGGRRITALKWSPDGKYLAYSVSKPPLEDELFYMEPVTGKCFQLPVRTGRAGWEWAR